MNRLIICIGIFLFTAPCFAVVCPSSDAASKGREIGINKDKQEIDIASEKEEKATDVLNKCIEGIVSIPTMPQFPSLSDIYQKVLEKTCKIVRDKATDIIGKHGKLGSTPFALETIQIPASQYSVTPLETETIKSHSQRQKKQNDAKNLDWKSFWK